MPRQNGIFKPFSISIQTQNMPEHEVNTNAALSTHPDAECLFPVRSVVIGVRGWQEPGQHDENITFTVQLTCRNRKADSRPRRVWC